ncbi:MAG TPA: CocE/NonD family hydrolase [Anaerolineae bacterium]|nr:CocE/NonD family hydrolase [Anaerolineae bacterium]
MTDKRNAVLISLLGVAAAGLGAYRARRAWLGRWLGLTPARYDVVVERDIRVPMPDGVTLSTDHYAPRSAGSFPAILIRTPYGLEDDVPFPLNQMVGFPARRFAERGYHVIAQSTRGRFKSEGEFIPFVSEADDGRATLDWIARQPWFNGALGMWGASYLGYVQWAVAAGAPPYLKALFPCITGSDLAPAFYPDGAFGLDTFAHWMYVVDEIDRPAKRSFWQLMPRLSLQAQARQVAPAFRRLPLGEADTAVLGHPLAYTREWWNHAHPGDPFWQVIDHGPGVVGAGMPIHLLSGWYDLLLRQLLADYAALKAAGRAPHLTIGPWYHANPLNQLRSLREGLDWFDAHLKGDRRRLRRRPVEIYVMGLDKWREMDDWPPRARETRYYLHGDTGLSTEPPAADSRPDGYRYDPARPTPSVGGPRLMPPNGPMDQRSLESRSDVLIYTTPPLEQDLDVIGPVRLELYVRSSLAHADFVGRMCDVHPDGRSINVCDGLFRIEPGKGAIQPDGSLRIEVDMWATAQGFGRGHRIRLQVASGAHPRWSRNLGAGEPLASGTRMLAADQTVYHDAAHPSALVLPVVK